MSGALMVAVLTSAIACSMMGDVPNATVELSGSGLGVQTGVPTASTGVSVPGETVVLGGGSAVSDRADSGQNTVVALMPSPTEVADRGAMWVRNEEVSNLDPTQFDSRQSFPYKDVYSGLTKLDPISGDIAPDLASTWQVSSDGLLYSFRLREGLRFSDGTRVEPADVHFSWARALSPELRSHRAGSVLGPIVGGSKVSAGDSTELSGFSVVDDQNFTVELNKPNAEWLRMLSFPVASVLSESNVKQWERRWSFPLEPQETDSHGVADPAALPVGTGAFKVARIDFWQNAVWMEPNEFHWSGEIPTTCVSLLDDTVISPAGTRFSVTDLDIISVDAETRGTVRRGADGELMDVNGQMLDGYKEVVWNSLPPVSFIALNTSVPPFDDLDFRRALLASADVSQLPYRYSILTPGVTPSGLIPPTFQGYVDRGITPPEFQSAKEFLLQSSHAESVSDLAITYYAIDLFSPDDFRILSRFWVEWLGLSVLIDGVTQTDFGYSVGAEGYSEFASHLEAGTLQLRFVEVDTMSQSPLAIFETLNRAFGPNSQSEEVADLRNRLDIAMAEQDSVKRSVLYTEIEQHILDRALAIPISWGRTTKVEYVREWIHGYEPSPYAPLSLEGVTVDTTHPDYPADRPCN